MADETTRCKFCGEEILAVAIKCKHCQSDLRESPAPAAPDTAPQTDYGAFLIAIPVIGAALAWFWVGHMNLFQSPEAWLWFIAIVVIAATAILAQREDAAGGSGDAKWPVTMALVWAIAYPAYLRHRESRGLRNLLVPGVAAAVVFLGSLLYVQSGIHTAIAEANADIAKFEAEAVAAEAEAASNMSAAEAELAAATVVVDPPADTEAESAGAEAQPEAQPETAASEPPPAVAETIEAGTYAASGAQTLNIEQASDDELQFTLTLGAAVGEACEEGVVDCITIAGSAARDGAGYRFASDDDCAFSIDATEGALTISHSAGACGTGSANRHLLASINGTYTMLCRDDASDTWQPCE